MRLSNITSPSSALIIWHPLYDTMKPPNLSSSSALANGRRPEVGLPEASTMRTPMCCTFSKAANVRLLISFALLSNVPSTSRTNNLYFIALVFWVFLKKIMSAGGKRTCP